MITLNKYNDSPNRIYLELYGLSTDEKPITMFDNVIIGNASTLLEMDTGALYMYDEENAKWHQI